MSVDRKDSNKGYTVDNIAICNKKINISKGQFAVFMYRQLCKQVYKHAQTMNWYNTDFIAPQNVEYTK